jgi:poly-gamma-glutamate capsule biosynthesis protein CapA/YwtB (metallophosphatase superfamily)
MKRLRTSRRSRFPLIVGTVVIVLLAGVYITYFSGAGRVSFHGSPFENVFSSDIELLFVGDIMLSRNIGKLMVKQDDWSYPYKHIRGILKGADLLFGNFENPVSDRGVLSGSIYSFRVDPQAISALREAGFDIVSLANNHIWDYGRDAFTDTLSILRNNSILPVGAGADFTEAHTPVVVDVKGTKIAFLAYTRLLPGFLGKPDAAPAVAYPDPEQIARDVAQARTQADIVVTSFHWGEEYQTSHNAEQERLAFAAIDAGADLVIGHHPHVMQEVEKYNDGYIAYSLGNFIFDQNFSDDTHHGLMLRVKVKNKKVASVEKVEVTFNQTYQPTIEK